MNPAKRKDPENYINYEIEDKRLKTDPEPIHPQIPVEVWTRIGSYLDNQSRLNLSSTAKNFESDIFWSYFDRNSRLQLKDLSDYPPKLRYFFKKKLLALLMLLRKPSTMSSYLGKMPDINFAQTGARKYLVSKEARQNKDSLSHLKCHLSDIFSWSTTQDLLGEGKWPEILSDISISVIQAGSTPFENLVAGWVAARKCKATARSYFDHAYFPIKETYLIACTDPSPCSKSERIDLAATAAKEGYFLPLETLLKTKHFNESNFEKLKEHPPTLAWKANYLFKYKNEYKEAAKYYDQALSGYLMKSPSDFSTLGRGFLKTLGRAIFANSDAQEHQRVCDLYEIAEKIYGAKNRPIPDPIQYPAARSFCLQSSFKKGIVLFKEWVKDKNSEKFFDLGNAFIALSFSYEKLSKYKKALANGRLAIETFRQRKENLQPDALVLVGDLETICGDNLRALDLYVEAEKGYERAGPIPPDFLFQFAKIYKKENFLDSSLDYLERSRLAFQTTTQPIPHKVYLEMALVFEAQGEHEKALQSYLKITINFEEFHEKEFLENYAKISVKFSKFKEALSSFRAIHKSYNTKNQAPPQELCEDISLVIRQVENNPPHPEVLLALGKLYLELNEQDKAFASLESFFQTTNRQRHPLEFAEAAHRMAALCWEMQKMPQGLEYVNLAFEANELQGRLRGSLYEFKAHFHYVLGDFASASDFFRQAFDVYEKNQSTPGLDSFWIWALTERELGHLDKCLHLLRCAVETSKKINPPEPHLYLDLALALHSLGQEEEAVEAYYFAIYAKNIKPSLSIVEKAAELSFKIRKISYALYFYEFILGAYVGNKLPIPAAILERVKDLNEITSEMSLTEYDLNHLVNINRYTGNLEKTASALELLLENPSKIVNKNLVRQNLLSCYASLQNHDKVFEITNQVFQQHQVSVSVPFELYKACGKAHLKLGRPGVAAKFFAFAIHALELPPYHKQPPYQPFFELHHLLGLAYEKMGEAAKAVEIYNSARMQFPIGLSAFWLRKIAKKNAAIGNSEEAIFCYEEACRAYLTKEQAIPIKILTEIEKIAQERTEFTTKALFCLAEIYFKFGKLENAIRYYKMNVFNVINKKSEYYYKSIFNLALSYEAQGKLKNALKFYKLARDVFSSLELPVKEILSKISDVHFQLQNYKSAQKYFDQALELSKNEAP
ncbi:MAG: hypothetical protein CK425_08070 [Parachlamydia sp.]|nr:MAG: hypothetical protein CK425_08070 [Parachlamydia sp.]